MVGLGGVCFDRCCCSCVGILLEGFEEEAFSVDEFSTEVPGDEECGGGEGEGKDIEDVGEPVPDGGVEPEQ